MPSHAERSHLLLATKFMVAAYLWACIWSFVWKASSHDPRFDYALMAAVPAVAAISAVVDHPVALSMMLVFQVLALLYMVLLYSLFGEHGRMPHMPRK